MTKRSGLFDVTLNLENLYEEKKVTTASNSKRVKEAEEIIIKQMVIAGYRKRTISDYQYYIDNFLKVTKVEYLEEITQEKIYEWLDSMNVSNQTKLTRLKCLKAFLGRCFDNRWIESKFWKVISIKVDNKVKEGATDKEVNLLLSLLDLTDYIQLRDAVATLLMYRTGIRLKTLSELEECHIDFDSNLLLLDGEIMKNRQQLKLPIDNTLKNLLLVLIEQNQKIRQVYKKQNNLVFVTKRGDSVQNSTTNAINRRLKKYSKQYGINNINPHALRRGFAKNLLDKGANITLISKALGHSNIEVTTKYLFLDTEEVANGLRDFL